MRKHGVGCMLDWVESDLVLKEKTANIQARVPFECTREPANYFFVVCIVMPEFWCQKYRQLAETLCPKGNLRWKHVSRV